MHRYLSAYVICSEKLSSRKTVSFSEQKMSRDNIRAYFRAEWGYCVYYPSNIFLNTRSFWNWRISPGAYSVKVTRLDQAHANENIS